MYKIRRKGASLVMVQRELDGMEYLVFPALEETGMVRHMFGTRVGGVSEGKYATVNFSYTLGDRPECVDENYRRAARILTRDGDIGRFVTGQQTHTTNVRAVTEEDHGKGVVRERDYQDVDALITNVPGLVLTTFHADCPPVYIVDPVRRAIGLAHSGWKGTIGEISRCTLERMAEEYGTRPEDCICAIGPSICQSSLMIISLTLSPDSYLSSGILADISKITTEREIDVVTMNVRTNKQGMATISMSFDVKDIEELNKVIAVMQNVESVIDIERN